MIRLSHPVTCHHVGTILYNFIGNKRHGVFMVPQVLCFFQTPYLHILTNIHTLSRKRKKKLSTLKRRIFRYYNVTVTNLEYLGSSSCMCRRYSYRNYPCIMHVWLSPMHKFVFPAQHLKDNITQRSDGMGKINGSRKPKLTKELFTKKNKKKVKK